MLTLPYSSARIAVKSYVALKREAASLKIQTKLRGHLARKSYTKLKLAVIALQTGIRVAAARAKFRYEKRTKGALIIQVSLLGIMYRFRGLIKFVLKC